MYQGYGPTKYSAICSISCALLTIAVAVSSGVSRAGRGAVKMANPLVQFTTCACTGAAVVVYAGRMIPTGASINLTSTAPAPPKKAWGITNTCGTWRAGYWCPRSTGSITKASKH